MRVGVRTVYDQVMRLVALLLMVQLAGCTIVGGALGRRTAITANRQHRARHEPETASPGARMVGGGLLGLLLDMAIVAVVVDGATAGLSKPDRL